MAPNGSAMSGAQKLASEEINLTRDFSAFLGRIVVDPSQYDLESAWRDRVRVWRDKNAYLFQDKYEQFVRDRGLEGKTAPALLALAFPILENAVVEEDEPLRDLWANLLVTVTDPARQAEVKRAFIHVIKQLDCVDAAVLNFLYRTYVGQLTQLNQDKGAMRGGFFHPRNAAVLGSTAQKTVGVPAIAAELALENLGRLRLIDRLADILGQQVSLSILGLKLMDACAVKPSNAL
jgi:hypothetical protein